MYPARDCFKREEARRKTESQREKGLERKREMSQLLWEKSGTWRWLVKQTRDSKPFFLAFATVCGVIPGVIGYCVMQFTSSHNEQLEAQLRKNARPESLMMGQVNRERLAEYLGELQRKENTNDRYVAALRGETLTRNPYVRIQPIPKESSTELPKKSNTELPKKNSTEAVQEKEPKK